MEQVCRYVGLIGLGVGTGMVLAQGLIVQGFILMVGLSSYIIYANWHR